MFSDFENIGNFTSYQRYRQYYFSLDVDWTKIRTKYKLVRMALDAMMVVKIPFPALECEAPSVSACPDWSEYPVVHRQPGIFGILKSPQGVITPDFILHLYYGHVRGLALHKADAYIAVVGRVVPGRSFDRKILVHFFNIY